MLETESKKYTLLDYIKLNWKISRLWVVIRAMDRRKTQPFFCRCFRFFSSFSISI